MLCYIISPASLTHTHDCINVREMNGPEPKNHWQGLTNGAFEGFHWVSFENWIAWQMRIRIQTKHAKMSSSNCVSSRMMPVGGWVAWLRDWWVQCGNSDWLIRRNVVARFYVKRYFSCQFMLQLFQIKSMPKDLKLSGSGGGVWGVASGGWHVLQWFMLKGLHTRAQSRTHSHSYTFFASPWKWMRKVSATITTTKKKEREYYRNTGILLPTRHWNILSASHILMFLLSRNQIKYKHYT